MLKERSERSWTKSRSRANSERARGVMLRLAVTRVGLESHVRSPRLAVTAIRIKPATSCRNNASHSNTSHQRFPHLTYLVYTAMAQEDDVKRIEEAKKLSKDQPAKAEQIYQEILSRPPPTSDRAIRDYENALIGLGELYRDHKRPNDLGNLIQQTRDVLTGFARAKTSKLISQRQGFLRQNLEVRLVALYMQKQSYYDALTLINNLLRELKRLDDKLVLVEVQLLESRVYHALGNVSKGRAALTSARTSAASVYCPPLLQAGLDMQSGQLHAEDGDFNTAFSYFIEAMDGFTSQDEPQKATSALQYMLLCKIMLNLADDVNSLMTSKNAIKYAGKNLDAMKAVARAHSNRSLEEYEQALHDYRYELGSDRFIARHLRRLYDSMLEQNLIKVIEPFSRVEISHVAEMVGLDVAQVERKLSQMILDHVIVGVLDQGAGVLEVFDEVVKDQGYEAALETVEKLNNADIEASPLCLKLLVSSGSLQDIHNTQHIQALTYPHYHSSVRLANTSSPHLPRHTSCKLPSSCLEFPQQKHKDLGVRRKRRIVQQKDSYTSLLRAISMTAVDALIHVALHVRDEDLETWICQATNAKVERKPRFKHEMTRDSIRATEQHAAKPQLQSGIDLQQRVKMPFQLDYQPHRNSGPVGESNQEFLHMLARASTVCRLDYCTPNGCSSIKIKEVEPFHAAGELYWLWLFVLTYDWKWRIVTMKQRQIRIREAIPPYHYGTVMHSEVGTVESHETALHTSQLYGQVTDDQTPTLGDQDVSNAQEPQMYSRSSKLFGLINQTKSHTRDTSTGTLIKVLLHD
ncbi:hypothetical protein MRB53_037982 [Persea americana]|nr:hypothetical protein MRB53_037982 [Persea americana]